MLELKLSFRDTFPKLSFFFLFKELRMATISLWWHMLVKENLDSVVLSMNSIANLVTIQLRGASKLFRDSKGLPD